MCADSGEVATPKQSIPRERSMRLPPFAACHHCHLEFLPQNLTSARCCSMAQQSLPPLPAALPCLSRYPSQCENALNVLEMPIQHRVVVTSTHWLGLSDIVVYELVCLIRLPCLSFPLVDLRPPLSDAAKGARCCLSPSFSSVYSSIEKVCPLVYPPNDPSPPDFKRQDVWSRRLRRQEREMILLLPNSINTDDTQSLLSFIFPVNSVKINARNGHPDWFIRLFFHWDVSL